MTPADHETQDAQNQDGGRRNRVEAVGRAPALAQAAFRRAGFADPTLVLRWREIVGGDVARLAQPCKLSEAGVLTLKAEPAAATFLQHQTRSLCDRINAYLGRAAVARLKFVPGAVASRPCPPARADRPAVPPPDDPVHRFSGSDALKSALKDLARTRAGRRHD